MNFEQLLSELYSGNRQAQQCALRKLSMHQAQFMQNDAVRKELAKIAKAHEDTFEKICLIATSWPCLTFFPLYLKMLDSSDVVHVSAALIHYHYWHPHLDLKQKAQVYPRLIKLLHDAIGHIRTNARQILDQHFCGRQVA